MKRYLLLTLIFCALLISCKKTADPVYLLNVPLSSGFEKAKEHQRGLILIASKNGCSMCEMFDVDLMKDKAYAQQIYENFVIQRVDDNAAGQRWLLRILNSGGVPVFLFFNKDGKLLGLKQGIVTKTEMLQMVKNTSHNEMTIDPQYKFGKTSNLATEDLGAYLNGLFAAQVQWEEYCRTKDAAYLKGIDKKLNNTLELQQSFYNNYLSARYYLVKGDTLKAKQSAENALLDNDPASLYFNGELRTELKMVLDKNYSVYEDAYAGVSQIEKQLGKLKYGSTTRIKFSVKNLGNKNLIIDRVLPDCGCTIASYTRTKIQPGASGSIQLDFKAEKTGEFSHMAYVQGNAVNGPIQLYIKGTVMGD
jgi:thioredoxin-related protein